MTSLLLHDFLTQALSVKLEDADISSIHKTFSDLSNTLSVNITGLDNPKINLVVISQSHFYISPTSEPINSRFSFNSIPLEFSLDEPLIHILVCEPTSFSVICSSFIDTAKAFKSGSFSLSVPLNTIGGHQQGTIGLAEVDLKVPQIDEVFDCEFDWNQFNKSVQLFFSSFRGLCDVKSRCPPFFIKNQSGQTLPMFAYVSSRVNLDFQRLPTPQHCSRFVSLIPVRSITDETLGKSSEEVRMLPAATSLLRYGDVIDLCNLLCSMLSCFGLSSFVCIGDDSNRSKSSFVITLDTSSMTSSSILFWDAVSGRRYSLEAFQNQAFLLSIDYIYNNSNVYLNIQGNNSLGCVNFNLEDPQHWLSFNQNLIRNYNRNYPPFTVNLGNFNINTEVVKSKEIDITSSICSALEDFRKVEGRFTKFSDSTRPILKQAMYSYENERIFGVSVSSDLFAQSIKQVISPTQTFRAVPIQIKNSQINESIGFTVLSTLNSLVAGKELLNLDSTALFNVQVSIFPYTEEVFGVWCVIAVVFEE
ncbi:hypothetical protein P9112_012985 [Eukaryota sp. TZLM1-RC]